MFDLGDARWWREVRWRRGQRQECRVYEEKKEKQRGEGLRKRQRSRSRRDGWGERIWMREARRCFCKRSLIKDLPKMPVMLRVPSWLLIWKPILLIWGFGGDVQLELLVEQLMSCQRGKGRAMALVVRNNVISFLAPSWLYTTCGFKPDIWVFARKRLGRRSFLSDITFDETRQVRLFVQQCHGSGPELCPGWCQHASVGQQKQGQGIQWFSTSKIIQHNMIIRVFFFV